MSNISINKRLFECARQAHWIASELQSIHDESKDSKLSTCVLYADTLETIKQHLLLLSQSTDTKHENS